MKRILPAPLRRNYLTLALRPARRKMSGTFVGCGLRCEANALGLHPEHDSCPTESAIRLLTRQGYDGNYLDGFWQGFDDSAYNYKTDRSGIIRTLVTRNREGTFNRGYRDGIACGKAMFAFKDWAEVPE
jgi:hypothetical protein